MVFVLDSANLPAVGKNTTRGGHVFTLKVASPATELAPLTEVDYLLQFRDQSAVSTAEINFPENPENRGVLYSIPLNFTPARVDSLEANGNQFMSVASPTNAELGTYWYDEDNNTVRALGGQPTFAYPLANGDTLRVNSTAATVAPGIDAQFRQSFNIAAWDNFVVTKVYAQGLTFTEAVDPMNPAVGEFWVDGTTVRIQGVDYCYPQPGTPVEISGYSDYVLGDPNLLVEVFNLNIVENFSSIASILFRGKVYQTAADAFNPIPCDLIYNLITKRLSLFA